MILAIESSCDESAVAVFDPAKGLCFEEVQSQIKLHSEYGGVVPDLASREHLTNLPLLLKDLAKEADLTKVTEIAVTAGPGLAGCLALGISSAKALALKLNCPLVGVNHLRGHAFSSFISLHAEDPENFEEALQARLPHLGLIVSGGNTILFSIDEKRCLSILAETIDDAAGEALDKGAKLLGFPYPGGPLIEKRAEGGNIKAHDFPRAFRSRTEMRFSFSGLKTSLRYKVEAMDDAALEAAMPDLCASYQQAVVDALVGKTQQVLKQGGWKSLGLSGGVANNDCLRTAFSKLAAKTKLPLHIAEKRHTGDNAAMIAFAAAFDREGRVETDQDLGLSFYPSWPLSLH